MGRTGTAALGQTGTIKIMLSISPVPSSANRLGSLKNDNVLVLRFHDLHRYTPLSLSSLPASKISSSLGHIAGVALRSLKSMVRVRESQSQGRCRWSNYDLRQLSSVRLSILFNASLPSLLPLAPSQTNVFQWLEGVHVDVIPDDRTEWVWRRVELRHRMTSSVW